MNSLNWAEPTTASCSTLYPGGPSTLATNWYSTVPFFRASTFSLYTIIPAGSASAYSGTLWCIGTVDPQNRPVYVICPSTSSNFGLNGLGNTFNNFQVQLSPSSIQLTTLDISGSTTTTAWGWGTLSNVIANSLIIDMDGVIKMVIGGTATPLHLLSWAPLSNTPLYYYYTVSDYMFYNTYVSGTPTVYQTGSMTLPQPITSFNLNMNYSIGLQLQSQSTVTSTIEHSLTNTQTASFSFSTTAGVEGICQVTITAGLTLETSSTNTNTWSTQSTTSYTTSFNPIGTFIGSNSVAVVNNNTIVTLRYPSSSTYTTSELKTGLTVTSPMLGSLTQTVTYNSPIYTVISL
jgi:hypothetical protein